MDEATYQKLKKNPFYKFSGKQREEENEFNRRPMIDFGNPPIQNTTINRHETLIRKNGDDKVSRKKRFNR